MGEKSTTFFFFSPPQVEGLSVWMKVGSKKTYGMFFLYSYFENNVCVILMIILIIDII